MPEGEREEMRERERGIEKRDGERTLCIPLHALWQARQTVTLPEPRVAAPILASLGHQRSPALDDAGFCGGISGIEKDKQAVL